MFKVILALGLMIVSFDLHAQLVLKPPPKKPFSKMELEKEASGHPCIHRNKYTTGERLKFYPFDSAVKVQAVSFNNFNEDSLYHSPRLPILNDTICYTKLKEIITLTSWQVDSLTDIIYNVGYKGPVFRLTESNCFLPHNALLFINTTGKVFAYIEICFLCDGYQGNSPDINIGEVCDEKYNLLKKWFISLGIKTGTADEGDIVSFEPQ